MNANREFVSFSPSYDLEEDGTSAEVPDTVTDLTGNASYGKYFQKWLRDELARSWCVCGGGRRDNLFQTVRQNQSQKQAVL